MSSSAKRDDRGEWVYPQLYYADGKRSSKRKILQAIQNDPLIQECIRIEPACQQLLEEAKKVKCVFGYKWDITFYGYYKPRIVNLVGWKSHQTALRTTQHYDAFYDAILHLLPDDEGGLYPDCIMPNGMWSPYFQEKYGCEYP